MAFLPKDRIRLATNIAVLVWTVLYFWPGGAVLSGLDIEVVGWPLFALWVVVVGPVLLLSIFAYDSHRTLVKDMDSGGIETKTEGEEGEQHGI